MRSDGYEWALMRDGAKPSQEPPTLGVASDQSFCAML